MLHTKIRIALIALPVVIILTIGAIVATRVTQSSWSGVRSTVLPQLIPATQKEEFTDIITTPLSEEVDIAFVLDGTTRYTFITPENLERWSITEQTLFDTAMRNLDALSKDIRIEVAQTIENDPRGTYVIVELNDSYSAVRLLAADVRKAIGDELGNEYIAAIPTRDFLIFWHPEFPRKDAFISQIVQEYEAENELENGYPITSSLFRITKEGIQPLTPTVESDTER